MTQATSEPDSGGTVPTPSELTDRPPTHQRATITAEGFDFGDEPWGSNPPFHAPVFVLAHRGDQLTYRIVKTNEGDQS
jgi:hypothetical protein